MNKTTNYGFNLPSDSDTIEISVLDENFTNIDSELKKHSDELQPVTLVNSFEVISAAGANGFYHGTLAGITSLLDTVKTTLGDAKFRDKYGEFSVQEGEKITLHITVAIEEGTIYWDEYYNNYSDIPDDAVFIGTSICTASGGDTNCNFEYINYDTNKSKEYSLREAIAELAVQIQFLLRKDDE
jgi:hypothetical protein